MLEMERVRGAWLQRKGAPPTDADIDRMYAKFVPKNIAALKNNSKLIDGKLYMEALIVRSAERDSVLILT